VQKAQIMKWAKASGSRVIAWCTDEGVGGSNGVESRQALPEALDLIRGRRADAVVVTNLDRLARKLTVQEAILAHIWESGGRVFTVDEGEVLQDDPDDPMRTAMRQMRGVFHQLDRAQITKRLRDGRRMKAAMGGYAFGSPVLGKRAEGKALVPDRTEAGTVERIHDLRDEGMSLREIAAALEAEGRRTKRGGTRWHPTVVARVLQRARA